MVYLLALFPITCIAFALGYIIFDNATNHTAVDYLSIVLWPLGLCAILSFYKFKKEKNRRFLISLGANIAAILFFLFIDYFNIMVQYDQWLQRGMPDPFESSKTKKSEYPAELDARFAEVLRKFSAGKISREEFERESDLIDIEIQKYKEQKAK